MALGRSESGLTIYVGEAGEKYSDPEDWRDLVQEGRLDPDMLIAIRRGGKLLHQKAGDAPELAQLFAPRVQPVGAASQARTETAPTQWRTPESGLLTSPEASAPPEVFQIRLDKPEQSGPTPAAVHEQARPEAASAGPKRAVAASGPALFHRCLTRDFSRVSGRAGRREFWSFALGQLALLFALPVLAALAGTSGAGELNGLGVVLLIAWIVFALYCVVPAVSVTIRRLHDLGASAWVLLIVLVPYIGGVLLLIAAALPSQAGANRYGPAAA